MKESAVLIVMQESLREIMGDPSLKIEGQDKLIEDVGLESIDFIDLVFELEKRLNIRIDLESFSKEMMKHNVGRYLSVTVDDMVNLVKRTQSNS